MADESTPEQLREELREVDAEIATLRASAQDRREQLEGGGVQDAEEIAAELTYAEEQDAVLGILGRRRDALLEKLNRPGSAPD
jgi:hypothetical protein